MLSPDYLERCTDEVIKLYDELSDMILRDIVDRLISLDFEASATAAWRMEKLQELGRLTYADALREIAKITGKTEQELKAAFENAGTESMRFDNSVYKKAGLSPLPLAQSDGMLQVLTAGYKKCRGSLKNLTLTTANTAQSSFIQACNAAYMQVTSGAFSVNSAVKTAVASVGQSGTWVLYPTGHRDRLDVAVRRAVRTGVAQTCGQLQIQQLDDMMWDVVDTTAHADARESHTVWQGGRFSYKGRNPNYPDFEEATGYGSADGLMGINCRHGFFPAVDGSPRMYPKAQLAEWKSRTVTYNGTEYAGHEAVSMQRAYERGIRATKRELTALDEGAKASKDEALQRELSEAFSQTSLKLKRQEAALNDFLEQTGLKPDYERSQVREFDRSMSGKAKAAARKELTAEREKGIIKARGERIASKIQNIDSPIEQRRTGKGNPNAIIQFGRPLNNRQKRLLQALPEYDSRVIVSKKNVNMSDLAALTAQTGDEYALFTKGRKRLVVRGDAYSVNITEENARKLFEQGYKWSGHTHPGMDSNCLIHSPGDALILKAFEQNTSAIYNSKGQFELFKGGY